MREKKTSTLLLHLFYKEWLKTRWAFLCTTIIGLCLVWYIFTNVANRMLMTGAKDYTLKILYDDPPIIYYAFLKYIPLLIAVAVGLSQFVPEVSKKRYRLLLHLPVKNELLIMSMSFFGLLLLIFSYVIILSVFYWKNISFFPTEITTPVEMSLIPWFLGGYFVYNFIALITLEPRWGRRIIYFVTLYLLSDYFLVDIRQHGDYASSIPLLSAMVILTMPALLYSYNRLNKGV